MLHNKTLPFMNRLGKTEYGILILHDFLVSKGFPFSDIYLHTDIFTALIFNNDMLCMDVYMWYSV